MRGPDGELLGTFPWRNINIGGLGYNIGLSHAPDGSTILVWTDVGGSYYWDSDEGKFVQLIADATMPEGVIGSAAPGGGNNFGVFAMQVAPSNPAKWWMAFKDRVLTATKSGPARPTWTDTGLNGGSGLFMNANGGVQRLAQGKLVVDPANDEVVYLGTASDGLWRRLSGAWAQVASVPEAVGADADSRRILTAIDPTSSLVGSGATERRSVVYTSVHGVGLQVSADGGDSFDELELPEGVPSGPSYAAWFLFVSAGGVLHIGFVTGAHSNVWKYNGSWTQVTTFTGAEIRFLAQDPKDANRFVGLAADAKPLISLNNLTNFTGLWQPPYQASSANDVPIIADVLNQTFAAGQGSSAACIYPHPTEDRDYIAMGLGICYFDDPWPVSNTSAITWKERSAGIEELVAHSALITPSGSTILCSHDKAIIRSEGASIYPDRSYPRQTLTNGYACDYAIDDPDFLVCLIQKNGNHSGYSEDDGRIWTPFSTSYSARAGGSIAISLKTQIVVFPGQNGRPRYSADQGAAWTECVFTGITLPVEGSGDATGFGFGSTDTRRFIVCADKEVPGTFYAYNYGATGQVAATQGIWKSTDGGANWSRIASGEVIPAIAAGYHVQLICAGNGVLYITTGDTGSWFNKHSNTAQVPLRRSLDGGVTWETISGVTEAMIALGKGKYGSPHKALYMIGWDVSANYGLFVSHDRGDTIEALEYYDTFDQPYALAAAPSRFGRVVVGFSGTGWRERVYDYRMRLS